MRLGSFFRVGLVKLTRPSTIRIFFSGRFWITLHINLVQGKKILRSLYNGNYRVLSRHVVISVWEVFYITTNDIRLLTTCWINDLSQVWYYDSNLFFFINLLVSLTCDFNIIIILFIYEFTKICFFNKYKIYLDANLIFFYIRISAKLLKSDLMYMFSFKINESKYSLLKFD